MAKKRTFQVFDEMSINDEKNKTATCACCFDTVSANTAKGGGHVTMGVPAEAITKIMLGEYKPILILLDYTEYKRLETIPLEDTAQQRIKQLEAALSAILDTNHDNYEKVIMKTKQIATEALKKQ